MSGRHRFAQILVKRLYWAFQLDAFQTQPPTGTDAVHPPLSVPPPVDAEREAGGGAGHEGWLPNLTQDFGFVRSP